MILRTFLKKKNYLRITKGKGIYIFSKNKKYVDLTSGMTGHAILGWSNKKIINSIYEQAKKIGHIDYKNYIDPNREKLAKKILTNKKNNLNRVFLVGSSGSEACEAAIKMSYQYFYDLGKKNKNIFISRKQSYHGSTSQSLTLGDRPNLNFFNKISNKNVYKISEHNIYRKKNVSESELEYSKRSAKELEDQIIKIGPEKVCGFVGETITGGLTGDVPPSKNYWKLISEICKKYNIHLILDEVWCGTGVSGKIFCCDWDGINPDFVFIGKTLAAGYGALSAVITHDKITNVIKRGQGQIQYSNTHQGHSINVAAALSVQNIINNKKFLKSVVSKGNYLREYIENSLTNNDFFLNVRGRGLRNSIEYNCSDNNLFGALLKREMFDKYNTIIDSKWHRICLPLALNISKKELDENLDKLVGIFNKISKNWNTFKKQKVRDFIF